MFFFLNNNVLVPTNGVTFLKLTRQPAFVLINGCCEN